MVQFLNRHSEPLRNHNTLRGNMEATIEIKVEDVMVHLQFDRLDSFLLTAIFVKDIRLCDRRMRIQMFTGDSCEILTSGIYVISDFSLVAFTDNHGLMACW